VLTNRNVLVYGNKFSCYAAQFYNPSTNTWARTIGQCGNNVSYGPLVPLSTGKVLPAGDEITYSGHTSPTARCALYDPSTNTWTPTGSLLQATRRTATLLSNGKVLSVGGSDAELYAPLSILRLMLESEVAQQFAGCLPYWRAGSARASGFRQLTKPVLHYHPKQTISFELSVGGPKKSVMIP
jgi:hypothetical protein